MGQVADIGTKTDSECLTALKEADRLFQEGLYDKCIDDS